MLRKGFIFLRIVEVFQSKAHDRIHFMRIKEGKIFAFDEALHEEVRNGNRGKDIMGLAPIIAVIGPQFNKFIKSLCQISRVTVAPPLRLPSWSTATAVSL